MRCAKGSQVWVVCCPLLWNFDDLRFRSSVVKSSDPSEEVRTENRLKILIYYVCSRLELSREKVVSENKSKRGAKVSAASS